MNIYRSSIEKNHLKIEKTKMSLNELMDFLKKIVVHPNNGRALIYRKEGTIDAQDKLYETQSLCQVKKPGSKVYMLYYFIWTFV